MEFLENKTDCAAHIKNAVYFLVAYTYLTSIYTRGFLHAIEYGKFPHFRLMSNEFK
jgi:hypothetical protein